MTELFSVPTATAIKACARSSHETIGIPRKDPVSGLINDIAGATTDVEKIYDVYKHLPQMRHALAAAWVATAAREHRVRLGITETKHGWKDV